MTARDTTTRDDNAGIALPKCEVCGRRMLLSRRVPAPALGVGYEFRTFACRKCGHTEIRSSGPRKPAAGAPAPKLANAG